MLSFAKTGSPYMVQGALELKILFSPAYQVLKGLQYHFQTDIKTVAIMVSEASKCKKYSVWFNALFIRVAVLSQSWEITFWVGHKGAEVTTENVATIDQILN